MIGHVIFPFDGAELNSSWEALNTLIFYKNNSNKKCGTSQGRSLKKALKTRLSNGASAVIIKKKRYFYTHYIFNMKIRRNWYQLEV